MRVRGGRRLRALSKCGSKSGDWLMQLLTLGCPDSTPLGTQRAEDGDAFTSAGDADAGRAALFENCMLGDGSSGVKTCFRFGFFFLIGRICFREIGGSTM